MPIPRVTVLTSGRGSNLAALLAAEHDGRLGGTIASVISNRAEAPALAIAASHHVAATVIEHRGFAERVAFDVALGAAIDASEPSKNVRGVWEVSVLERDAHPRV